jgi:hypothetical protein
LQPFGSSFFILHAFFCLRFVFLANQPLLSGEVARGAQAGSAARLGARSDTGILLFVGE